MDPTSELEVRQKIGKLGLGVVGWYHSHPVFRPDPSVVDLENQRNYQRLFRNSSELAAPFVGVIIGPYDPAMPGPVSCINCFHVPEPFSTATATVSATTAATATVVTSNPAIYATASKTSSINMTNLAKKLVWKVDELDVSFPLTEIDELVSFDY